MAFKASKNRGKVVSAVVEGLQLIPSAPNRDWYNKQLVELINDMVGDYAKEIEAEFKTKQVKKFYAADAGPTSAFTGLFNRLKKKWVSILSEKAKGISERFVKKVDVNSKASVNFSISSLGIKEPVTTYNNNINATLSGCAAMNETLIKGLHEDLHEKVLKGVMLSITSPTPSEQGQKYVMQVLADAGISSKKRAKLIARDQTSKVYTSLNHDRMEQNGITHFKWVHSSAGKVPRHSHVEKDGKIFALNDPRLWEGPKADQGPPGWAINCRCRAVPVLDVD
ncbi:minor head/capsid protein [Aeromonas phage Gekk3-15]